MRRTARGKQDPASSLFPFLAVLLCTMGALVVLLVAMAHVSRDKAASEAEAARLVAEQAAQQRAARLAEDEPRRLLAEQRLAQAVEAADQFETLRDAARLRLTQEQKRLSDIEDHIRRLLNEDESLMTEAAELLATEQEHFDDERLARQELERLNRLAGQLEEEIEELRHAASGRERRYAIVPLRDQTVGTLRPQVYFECNAEGVVVQPEGLLLDQDDLIAPGVSSPVTAAIRAVRRFYIDHPEARAAGEQGEPYPLLVVRPDGVSSFYAARAALESAESDFGYQPVAEEWPIEYGEANPLLAERLSQAVGLVRLERRELAKLQPSLFRRRGPSNRRVAVRGGGTGASGGGGSITVRQADPRENNPFAGVRFDGVEGVAGPGGSGDPARPRGGGDREVGLLGFGSGDDPGQGGAPGAADEFAATTTGGGSGTDTDAGADGAASSGAASTTTASTGAAANGTAESGATAPSAAQTAQATGAAAPQGTASPAGAEGQPSQATLGPTSEAATAAATDPAAPPQPRLTAQAPRQEARDAQPESARQSSQRPGMAIVRPIRLRVTSDRVVLLDGSVGDAPRSVELVGPTAARINEVVALLREHAESWGIAGAGMYWDPRLELESTPDGARRATELAELLGAAGLKTRPVGRSTASNPPGGDHAPRR